MAKPGFIVEIAFASNPSDAAPVYTDVSRFVRDIEVERGRQHELDKMEAGTARITLKNLDRRFEPEYSGSPYYPNVLPMKPIRVRATLLSQTYTLFTGFVERWPQRRQGKNYAERQITAVDGFELLSNAILSGATYPQELSGARITRILNAASWSSTARQISTGNSQVQAYTFLSSDQVTALGHAQDIEETELGLFFNDGPGHAVFLDRRALLSAPYNQSQCTFSDQSHDAGAIPYVDIVPSYDKDLIVNDWVITRNGSSATQEALDSSAILKFFRRSQARSPLLTSDTEALAQAQFLLSRTKNPVLRHESVTIKPGDVAATWIQVLTREIGDRITTREHPPGGGTRIQIDSHIQHLKLTIAKDVKDSECAYQLLPADLTSYLVLDDAVNGKLDSNKLAY